MEDVREVDVFERLAQEFPNSAGFRARMHAVKVARERGHSHIGTHVTHRGAATSVAYTTWSRGDRDSVPV